MNKTINIFKNIWHYFLLGTIALPFSCTPNEQKQEKSQTKPNVIFILADDLGIGDLGAYGQELIDTPVLDQLAKDGMLFTNHYTGSTVCAPSRSALMTGLHTGHTPIRGNYEYEPEGQYPMPDTLLTLGKLFQNAGYATGAFGKWGLGFVGTEGDPNHQGFDTFFGYNCQRMAHRYYPKYLWENNEKVYLEGNDWTDKVTYAPDLIHQKSLEFIDAHANTAFFLFIPLITPHAELAVPEDAIFLKYRNRFGDEKPHIAGPGGDYGPEIRIPGYQSADYPRATYAAMVERLDQQVGDILQKLEAAGIDDNTIVIFASDNGPHLEGGNDPDFFKSNGEYRGYKRDLYEGGIRTPLIIKWPKVIKASTETPHVSAFWDFLPTFSDLLGEKVEGQIDGISFLPILKGEKGQKQHDYLYWEFVEQGGKQAIRKGKWKAVRTGLKNNPNAELELYDLEKDSSETHNIAASHPEIVEELSEILKNARKDNPIFSVF